MEAKLVCRCYFRFDFMIIKIQNKINRAKVEFVRMAVILKRISAEKKCCLPSSLELWEKGSIACPLFDFITLTGYLCVLDLNVYMHCY